MGGIRGREAPDRLRNVVGRVESSWRPATAEEGCEAPIIERDVDGPDSLPRRIDAQGPNLGKLHATRRVARTIYLGSAPAEASTVVVAVTA